MKILYGFVICLITTILMSIFVPSIKISDGAISTLYSISGIMFSIGMSLTVISNTIGVKNEEIRLRIRKGIKSVRNNFIICFGIVSVVFIAKAMIPDKMGPCFFYINIYWLLLTFLLFSIIYFIVNFISIQSLNEHIEEELNKQ